MPLTVEDMLGEVMNQILGVQQLGPPIEPDVDPVTLEPHAGHAHSTPPSGGKVQRGPGGPGLNPDQIAKLSEQIQKKFGVGSAGQWRSAADDAARRAETGRKVVSDHVSGHALDISGDPAKLDKVAAWAKEQPNVKYVLWRTKDHFDHVHISFEGA